MRDLKSAQQTFMEQLVRGQPGDVLARHGHAARCGRQHPGDHVEQRGFPGAIGSDQPGDRPRLDFNRRIINGPKTAEMSVQTFNCDQYISPGAGFLVALVRNTARVMPGPIMLC